MKNPLSNHRFVCSLALAVLALVPGVRAQTLTPSVITNFSRTTRYNVDALGALVQDAAGNFYGTTQGGGDFGDGSVYRVTAAGAFTTLYSFGGTDGAAPSSELLLYSDGNLYGTTFEGGTFGYGTVFRITPAGVLTTLHSFYLADGRSPRGGLVAGTDGNLYGTTVEGGATNTGTVFRISPSGGVTTVLHSFVRGDGTAPQAALVLGADGLFYGTTAFNGTSDHPAIGPGSVFRITQAGAFQLLHLFNADADGFGSVASLVQGGDGAFYGTNPDGGLYGSGTAFRITTGGAFTIIHTFSYTDGRGFNDDGVAPTAALVDAGNGQFYGLTNAGGPGGSGTVFSVTPGGAFSVLYDFSGLLRDGTNPEGANPFAGFVRGADGRFYVPTTEGGANAQGTVVAFSADGAGATPSFFDGQVSLGNGVYYLVFPNGNLFGYYSFLSDPNYLYHFDLGYEYVFDANDGQGGVYLYDFGSGHFFYTSPTFPFPYLYDFTLNAVLYYYPSPDVAGHYTSNPRYFYDFGTGTIITQ
ncbi:MAG: hypothetical protein INR65_17125 [Gluconacetobacter diazotrophicus]|nr:hypothetical protein [Gluconacetobacter diazotrophicus]